MRSGVETEENVYSSVKRGFNPDLDCVSGVSAAWNGFFFCFLYSFSLYNLKFGFVISEFCNAEFSDSAFLDTGDSNAPVLFELFRKDSFEGRVCFIKNTIRIKTAF